MTSYAIPPGGLPGQSELLTGRAIFTDAYAVIPRGTMRDIVTSFLPGWRGTRAWILARPLSGFAETFSWIVLDVAARGGADEPETDSGAEAALFVASGRIEIEVGDERHVLGPGGYAYLPPQSGWSLRAEAQSVVHWVRKRWQSAPGYAPPEHFVADEAEVPPDPMPDTEGRWATQRFVAPDDLAHDMHLNIVTFQPGAVIPFAETHVMEHGIYVLQGKAVYRLNGDWVEVEAGDFLWLRAFCPQACYAGGPEPFRYLLYKDVNRLPSLG
ncbi:bifunctional allantoicase/(S)-ureidoglycine aminohydrolase [Roseitranquillus sediminis]|uniref:bifunctional allantoicase/(S)-ureidoglycine aminohydrolase n=1 Tax=Roseitranquillus sediminis TaxID=2809051 RepID=UPI003872DBB2